MLALALLSLATAVPQEPRWIDAQRAGFHWTPSRSGHAFLELELPAASRHPALEEDGPVPYRLVAQRDPRNPPVHRTPRGVRSAERIALREVDEVLAEGVLRRPPVATAVLQSARGFVVLEPPFEGAVHERFGSYSGTVVENPHFLQVYDAAGELRYERRPSEVFTAAVYARLAAKVGVGCGTVGLTEVVHDTYCNPPGPAGLWEVGPLHVAVKGTGAGWVHAALYIESGERIEGEVTRVPYTVSPRGPCVGGDLALALLVDSDPANSYGLEGIVENEDAPLAMRVRAADQLGRLHRRAGRELLLDAASTREYDASLRYPVGLAAQGLGRVLDRSEAGTVVELARATPYDRNAFGAALLDMEEAGGRALVLALAEERDEALRGFLRAWFSSGLTEIREGDADVAAALGRLATEGDQRLAWSAWTHLCGLELPEAAAEQAAVVTRGGPHLRSLLERNPPRRRIVLGAVFERVKNAIEAGDQDELEFLIPRLRGWTDASASCRQAREKLPTTAADWSAWWERAQDRPQRMEVLGLADRAAGADEVSAELRRALDSCLASADPAGPTFAAEALSRFAGRIHDLGLSDVWRRTLAATRPGPGRRVPDWLNLWSAGPPRGADAEAVGGDAELLAALDAGQFVFALWSVYRDHDLELGPAVHELLRTCPTQSEAIERILALERERR